MPTFQNVEVVASVDIDFEVYCAECGAGLCNVSDTRVGRTRGGPQVVVGNCPHCVERIEGPLRERIEELEQLLEEAKQQ